MVSNRWAPALAIMLGMLAATACNDGGKVENPPAAPTINLSPPSTDSSTPKLPVPPPLDWDKDSIAPSPRKA